MKTLFRVFIFLLPAQLAYHFWPDFAFVRGVRVDYLAPTVYLTEVVLWVLLFWWIAKNRGVKKILLAHWKIVFAIFVFALINTINSSVPQAVLIKWLKVGELLLLYLFVRNLRYPLHLIKLPMALSLLFVFCLSVVQMVKSGSVGGLLYWVGERSFTSGTPGIALTSIFGRELLRPYATFAHPNAMAGFALVVFFLFWKDRSVIARAIVLLSGALVLLSFSQNAWLALLLTPLVYHIFGKAGNYWKFITTAAAASFFLTILTPFGTKEIVERVELNALAGKLISGNPFFGVGLGAFVASLPVSTSQIIWLLQPVHNIFLLITAELGILGLLVFTYFIGTNITKNNSLPAAAIILTGLFDHYWITILPNIALLFVVLGLAKNAQSAKMARDENLL